MIAWLRAVLYGLARALSGAVQRPLVTLLATGAVAVSLVLFGVVYLAAINVARLTETWGGGVQMVVYLADETPPERAHAIAQALERAQGIERVDYVPPDAAHARLIESLGDRKELLQSVELGYLPASLEVTLSAGIRDVAAVSPLVDRLRRAQGVEEVEFLGDWVDRVSALHRALRLAALALAFLVGAACIYVVAGTIKLGIYARREEIEVMKLVGATDRFITGPLVVEGAIAGACGAGVACGLLWLLYRTGAPALGRMLSVAVGEVELSFIPGSQLCWVVAVGSLFGVVGSWFAVGRYAEV